MLINVYIYARTEAKCLNNRSVRIIKCSDNGSLDNCGLTVYAIAPTMKTLHGRIYKIHCITANQVNGYTIIKWMWFYDLNIESKTKLLLWITHMRSLCQFLSLLFNFPAHEWHKQASLLIIYGMQLTSFKMYRKPYKTTKLMSTYIQNQKKHVQLYRNKQSSTTALYMHVKSTQL